MLHAAMPRKEQVVAADNRKAEEE
eukprot:COSAG05_NODE_19198_length_296_cov_0.791878_1_plen_23_part_10